MKTYVTESNSREADAVLLGTLPPLPLTHFQELEVRNAMRLKHSRGELSEVELQQSLGDFQADIDAGRFERPIYDIPAVFSKAGDLSTKYTVQTKARSLDILHVAAALEIGSRDFASFDDRQRAVAEKAGLNVIPAVVPQP